MRIEFTKMSGAGNDFILLGPEYAFLKTRASDLARLLCARRTSVGADGLIIVDDADGDIFMHYLNSDGSEASFCGNGARCLVLFCMSKGIVSGCVTFRSKSGVHSGWVTDAGVRIRMRAPVLLKETSIRAGGEARSVSLVDSGVPHAIILAQAIDSVDVEGIGGEIRRHPFFGSEGANVDFVDTVGPEPFAIRTYERGVERETLACGSGCVAAAYLLRHRKLAGDVVNLRVASGDVLTAEFPPEGHKGEVYLTGPAHIVFEGWIELKE